MDEQQLAKLKRSGVSPAAVFGRSGRPYGGPDLPVVIAADAENRWVTPALPTWAMADHPENCKVIAKAIEKYGARYLGRRELGKMKSLICRARESGWATPPDLDGGFVAETPDGKLAFIGLDRGDFRYAGVPFAYLWRRYGWDRLSWRQDKNDGLLSAWLSVEVPTVDCVCVALIAPCQIGALVTPEQPPGPR